MEAIEISIDGVSLTIVKQSLSIKDDNNSFTSSFKVPHSSTPFLIVKDAVSSHLLDIDTIQSTGKKKIVPCKVRQGSIIYDGQLVVLRVLSHAIKCDVSHYSNLLTILKNPLSSFMPVISVIDDPSPEPYTTESLDFDDSSWDAFSSENAYNQYPEDNFCLPWIYHDDKYGVDAQPGDEWFYFAKTLNGFYASTGQIVRNSTGDGDFDSDASTPDTREYFNVNVAVPCVFVLAPIREALKSLGYKLSGDFADDIAVQRSFILTENDQLTKIVPSTVGDTYTFLPPFLPSDTFKTFQGQNITLNDRSILISHEISEIGTFEMSIDVDASNTPFNGDVVYVSVHFDGNWVEDIGHDSEGKISGTVTIDANIADIGKDFTARYIHLSQNALAPDTSSVIITKSPDSNSLYKFNNTIELGRFVPDMTLVEYINKWKNFKNLEVTIDDVSRTMRIDYNENKIKQLDDPIAIPNLQTTDFSPQPNASFKLAFGHDGSESITVTAPSLSNLSDEILEEFTKEITFDLKTIPHDGVTSRINEDFEDLSGFAIGFFNASSGSPFTVSSVNGTDHTINGVDGVYENNWRRWLKFRLNASEIEVSGSFSSFEIQELKDNGKVYFNSQLFLIKSMEYVEQQNTYDVNMILESVNY